MFKESNRLVNRYKRLILAAWVIYTVYYLLILVINNRQTLSGRELARLQSQDTNLKIENKLLEDEIATRSSLLYIQPLAKKMGFVPMNNIQWFKGGD